MSSSTEFEAFCRLIAVLPVSVILKLDNETPAPDTESTSEIPAAEIEMSGVPLYPG